MMRVIHLSSWLISSGIATSQHEPDPRNFLRRGHLLIELDLPPDARANRSAGVRTDPPASSQVGFHLAKTQSPGKLVERATEPNYLIHGSIGAWQLSTVDRSDSRILEGFDQPT